MQTLLTDPRGLHGPQRGGPGTYPPPEPRICAIVVSYQPDVALLARVLGALAPQVACVLVLDNATEPPLAEPPGLADRCRFYRCTSNRGLAWTQNMGARWAWRHGFDAVLLMDQDSVPAPQMVAQLVQTWAAAAGAVRVAAVSPQPVDHASGRRFPLVRPQYVQGLAAVRAVGFVIASGMLIPRAAWQTVGPMRAALFIDHIDTDWCLRATTAGWRLLVDTSTSLQHRLGDGGDWIWLGRRRWLPRHSPLRNYYMLRNACWLLGHSAVPVRHTASLVLRALAVVGVAVLVQPLRLQRLRKGVEAVVDALAGRLGPYSRCEKNATRKDYAFRENIE